MGRAFRPPTPRAGLPPPSRPLPGSTMIVAAPPLACLSPLPKLHFSAFSEQGATFCRCRSNHRSDQIREDQDPSAAPASGPHKRVGEQTARRGAGAEPAADDY
jgi:hypothetical protein